MESQLLAVAYAPNAVEELPLATAFRPKDVLFDDSDPIGAMPSRNAWNDDEPIVDASADRLPGLMLERFNVPSAEAYSTALAGPLIRLRLGAVTWVLPLPSTSWLLRVVRAAKPMAVEPVWPAMADRPKAVDDTPEALAPTPRAVAELPIALEDTPKASVALLLAIAPRPTAVDELPCALDETPTAVAPAPVARAERPNAVDDALALAPEPSAVAELAWALAATPTAVDAVPVALAPPPNAVD